MDPCGILGDALSYNCTINYSGITDAHIEEATEGLLDTDVILCSDLNYNWNDSGEGQYDSQCWNNQCPDDCLYVNGGGSQIGASQKFWFDIGGSLCGDYT